MYVSAYINHTCVCMYHRHVRVCVTYMAVGITYTAVGTGHVRGYVYVMTVRVLRVSTGAS